MLTGSAAWSGSESTAGRPAAHTATAQDHVEVPLLTVMLALLREVETGRRLRSEDHLRELERML